MNTITIELCPEDRARLDRLAEALEKRSCDKCGTAAVDYLKAATTPQQQEAPEAPKVATEEAKASTAVTTPPTEEKPVEKEISPPVAEKKVSIAELRAKFIELSAKGLKPQATDIVKAYAPTIPAVPEEKLAECYEKLAALEAKA